MKREIGCRYGLPLGIHINHLHRIGYGFSSEIQTDFLCTDS